MPSTVAARNPARTIVVTGATGFVGRRLIRKVVEAYGAGAILCLAYDQADNELERSGRSNLEDLGVRYVPVDLVTGRGLEHAPRSPDLVLHLASNTDTGASDHRINDVGTRNLFEAIRPLPAAGHFIFTSTIAVADHRADASKPVDEDTPLLRPFNDYGRRKLAAEAYLRERASVDGFRCTIVRLSAVYGQGTRGDGLFDRLSRMAREDSLIARLDYPGKLSFVNVDDIAKILVLLSQRESPSGSAELFIPVGEVMTIAELIQSYYRAFGVAYRPIKLSNAFWRFCDRVATALYRLEPVLPHALNNRIWQLGLVVGTAFHNESAKTQRVLPGLELKRFKDAVGEMIR
jgi:nucleoside-diphosphate-sugar epimerase